MHGPQFGLGKPGITAVRYWGVLPNTARRWENAFLAWWIRLQSLVPGGSTWKACGPWSDPANDGMMVMYCSHVYCRLKHHALAPVLLACPVVAKARARAAAAEVAAAGRATVTVVAVAPATVRVKVLPIVLLNQTTPREVPRGNGLEEGVPLPSPLFAQARPVQNYPINLQVETRINKISGHFEGPAHNGNG